MSLPMFIWTCIFATVCAFAYAVTKMAARRKQDEETEDTGLIILEFGRAYPNEAIRAIRRTADRKNIFVRLHDDKTGFMKSLHRHYACHLIEPGRVHVQPSGSGKGLALAFLDAPHHDGIFEFAAPEDAAEVSLWLLGNYLAAAHAPRENSAQGF